MINQMEQFVLLLVFAVLYFLIYRKSKRFRSNRFYLLSALVLSALIPLLSFDVFPQEVLVEKVRSNFVKADEQPLPYIPEARTISYKAVAYWIGFFTSLVYFCLQLLKVKQKIGASDFKRDGAYKISISAKHASSSFFNYIFIENESDILRKHEEAHAHLWHSIDRIFVGIFQIVFWFNPLVYLFRYWIIENHEFEADEYAIENLKIKHSEYGQFLFNQKIASLMASPILNQFHSLIKNRIHMLSNKSKGHPFQYLLFIALVVVMGSAFTLKDYPVYIESKSTFFQDSLPRDTTIIFDPEEMTERMVFSEQSIIVRKDQVVERIDTTVVFDPETYQESMTIERVSFPKIKDEGAISAANKKVVMQEIASRSTYYVETSASSPYMKVNFAKGHSGFVAEMINPKKQRIIEVLIEEGVFDYDFSKLLELDPGDYYIRRTDGGQRIDLKLK